VKAETNRVVVTGGFDDIRSRDVRFLEEASRFGRLTVLLWSDERVATVTGQALKFPFLERSYFLSALRYVDRVVPTPASVSPDTLPDMDVAPAAIWVDAEESANEVRAEFARASGIAYKVLPEDELAGFPEPHAYVPAPGRKKVVVTGCYDWFHSGHVRFFEEVSAYGDLYVVLGHDANLRLLKGEGHPLVPEQERRYLVGSVRFVKQALISSGQGWLDADPEIQRLKPDIYAVNEDGDKGGKRPYCQQRGIEYLVLKRAPAPGLPARSSTNLRGY
jgi:cytidyltransferase-like protein